MAKNLIIFEIFCQYYIVCPLIFVHQDILIVLIKANTLRYDIIRYDKKRR